MQASTFLGLAMIALIWGALEFHLRSEYARAKADAVRTTSNLARVFEDQIVRSIQVNDRILRSLQLSSVLETLGEDFERWGREVDGAGDFMTQLSMIDMNGRLSGSNLGPVTTVVDLADREHFRVHQESDDAGLFISKPVFGRVSNKWSIQLSRAIRGPHGAFAGVVVASLSPEKLANFYQSVDLGKDGAIVLVGLDGVVRASAGLRVDAVGRSMANSQLLARLAEVDEGSFVSKGMTDGVPRVMSYRAVNGYPLAILVGRSEQNVFGTFAANSSSYRLVAAGVTLFILIIVIANVRHRRRLDVARVELRNSERLANAKSRELELTLDHMSQGIMMIDKDETVALMNRQAVKLLGLPEDFIASRPKFDELVELQKQRGEFGSDGGAGDATLRAYITAGLSVPILKDYERVRPDGSVLEVRSATLPDGGFVRTFTDISERKRSEDKIAHMALHDALTGLANRVLLRRDIENALARYRRDGQAFSLFLIDLDHFKEVNDTFGHAAGDELLRGVAQRLRDCVRETDTVARLGGDEFAVLQCGATSHEDIGVLAARIVTRVSASYMVGGQPMTIGTSIGIANAADGPAIETLFHNADIALYKVKSEGRNDYRIFEPRMVEEGLRRRQLEGELRQALERGEFELHYQPMYDLRSGDIAAVEALLRWNHPRLGRVAPGEFMTIAEDVGLMPAIDSWVMETACAEATRWPIDAPVAVNLSPAKFKRGDFVAAVERVLRTTGLPPHRLELEISERILLRGSDEKLASLSALQALGVRIALDDFGTGNTSLADLRTFSFDKIKIDQSFVAEMESSQGSAAIVAAIAGLGRNLGAETTAEGVECQRLADLARAAGCTQAQGYFFSRPISAADFATLIEVTDTRRPAVA